MFINERDAAALIGATVEFLRRDRYGARKIPFIKLGRLIRYERDVLIAHVRSLTVGGAA